MWRLMGDVRSKCRPPHWVKINLGIVLNETFCAQKVMRFIILYFLKPIPFYQINF